MDKDFIIWLLTVICISWLIMLTIYAFKLKQALKDLRGEVICRARLAGDLRRDVSLLYKRVHDLEKGIRPESLVDLCKRIDILREKAEKYLAAGETALANGYFSEIDNLKAFIKNYYGGENDHEL